MFLEIRKVRNSLFNLLSNSNQPLGNSVSSTTKEFISKTSHNVTYIDTIGFRDTEDENEHKLKIVLFLKEIRNGFDISIYSNLEFLNQSYIYFLVFFFIQKRNSYNICRPWTKNVLLD